jgi:hypothetical protein
MSDTSFTPGPWFVVTHGKLRSWTIQTKKDGAGRCIAQDYGIETNMNNAMLIAAAPELYAALEALLLRLYITAEIRDGDKELRAQAEAALKKAKGL